MLKKNEIKRCLKDIVWNHVQVYHRKRSWYETSKCTKREWLYPYPYIFMLYNWKIDWEVSFTNDMVQSEKQLNKWIQEYLTTLELYKQFV